jgi:hypothetical protein
MHKTYSLTLFVTIFHVAIGYSIEYYQAGDTLWTWAPSGLSFRSAPGIKSKVMEVLPFGTSVVALENRDQNKNTYSIEIFTGINDQKTDEEIAEEGSESDFTLHGHWIKVKVGEKTGYVFDGYLSHLRSCNLASFTELFRFDSCMIQQYPILDHLKTEKIVNPQDYSKWEQYTLKGGIILGFSSTEKGYYGKYYFYGAYSLEEGYLIVDALLKGYRDVKIDVQKKTYDYLELYDDNLCTYKIYCISGSLLITQDCHC